VCREFGLVNCTIRTKIIARLNRRAREYGDFESLNEMTSIIRCVSGLRNREVTVHPPVSGPVLMMTVVVLNCNCNDCIL
jgi:hypothetical protein